MISEVSPHSSVTLDGSGNGQVSIGPPSGAIWRLRLASVSTTGTVKQPQCFLYRGSTSGPLEQIDSTYLGNSASSNKVAGAPFFQGQVLWAKWTGGDAGATATLQAYGQQGRRDELGPFDTALPVGEGFPLNVANVFQAGNTVINNSGVFVYNGTPGAGNPPIVAITTASKDPFGNTVQPSDSPATSPEFIVLGTAGSYAQIAAQAGVASLLLGSGDASETVPGFLDSGITGAGSTRQLVTELASPDFPSVNPATIQLFSDSLDGTVKSQINLNCVNRTVLGLSGNAWWSDNTGVNGQLNLPASGGPFIFGETFHAISLASGLSGTIRCKKTPFNMIYLDVLVSWTTTSATTFTCGSLPDSSYYPTVQQPNGSSFLALGSNMTPSGTSAAPRVVVPSSGALQVIVPASTGGGNAGWRGFYATN